MSDTPDLDQRLRELTLALSLCDSPHAVLQTLAASLKGILPVDHLVLLPRNARPGDEASIVSVDRPDAPAVGDIRLREWNMLKLGEPDSLLIDNPDSGTLVNLFPDHSAEIRGLLGVALEAPGVRQYLLLPTCQPALHAQLEKLRQIAPRIAAALAVLKNTVDVESIVADLDGFSVSSPSAADSENAGNPPDIEKPGDGDGRGDADDDETDEITGWVRELRAEAEIGEQGGETDGEGSGEAEESGISRVPVSRDPFEFVPRSFVKEPSHALKPSSGGAPSQPSDSGEDISSLTKDLEHLAKILEHPRKRSPALPAAERSGEKSVVSGSISGYPATGCFHPDFLITALTELRRPMTSIIGFAHVLHAKLEDQPIVEHVQEIITHAHQHMELVNDLLLLARAETGRIETHSSMRINPAQLIAYTIESRLDEITRKGLETKVEIDPKLPGEGFADGNLIRIIFSAILNHSISTTERGHVRISVSNHPVDDSEVVQLIVRVSDTGPGYRSRELHELFVPSFPIQDLDIGGYELRDPTALKLPTARHLAIALGGSLTAESKYGLGTTFTLRIPLRLTPPDSDVFSEVETPFKRRRRKGIPIKILIIDNHTTFRMSVLELLRSNGYNAFEARDSLRGLNYLKQQDDFEIALIDLDLEPVDGYETAEKIRKELKREDLILLALSSQPVDSEPVKNAGFNEVLDKPISWQKLNRALLRWTR